jgi:DGQHR domain-containing protein
MSDNTVTLTAMVTPNLDTVCYRGSAPLALLTKISQADKFDQVTNPNGMQRELSKKHALDVYDYVSADPNPKRPRVLPEVMLSVRDRKVVDVETLTEGEGFKVVAITVDLDAITKAKSVKVSRLDGNHRLMFGAGDGKDRGELDAPVPFQLHLDFDRNQERSVFLDINANQKSLNTSQLAVQRLALTTEQAELSAHPARVYAKRLAEDAASPFFQKVFMGGSKDGAVKAGLEMPITFTALESAIKRMLRNSSALELIEDADAVYAAILHYWQAVADVWGEEFGSKDTLLFKSIGISTLAQVAPGVLDRLFNVGDQLDALNIAALLKSTKDAVDWGKDAHHSKGAAGMSGNRAVLLLATRMVKELPKLGK